MKKSQDQITKIIDVRRITAIWAFSESAFGGILHALKIPLTGMFIGGAAVIFITLIAFYSEKKSYILKATLLVILVKAFVSPYTPLTAYFAVALQGILGFLLFTYFPFKKFAPILLGFFSLLFSAFQKLIVLVVLFGTTIWEAFDLFINYILSQFGFHNSAISYSLIITLLYCITHISFGLYIGIKAGRIPHLLQIKSIKMRKEDIDYKHIEEYFKNNRKRKSKRWWQRPSGITLIIISITLIILSYFSDELGLDKSYQILIMIIRSIIISFIWFSILSPVILQLVNRFIEKNKLKHVDEINFITSFFPSFRTIVNYSWIKSSEAKGVKRIKLFISDTLVLLLSLEVENETNLHFIRTNTDR